ncbi:hypothetical protein SCP_0106140 [Sparassis crispa]|uniref:Conserved oligomeric Golgi complex subunit 1 n=1 Tax=Sparassis crispa TaxID=139825 RepID=A0A401G6D9_9APHY|nr:hypothetical protein SCP_0106140 [Sparassis crispa]GBE77732.1 hypothetical protein SCP_0106140 [Sparassis crispa]
MSTMSPRPSAMSVGSSSSPTPFLKAVLSSPDVTLRGHKSKVNGQQWPPSRSVSLSAQLDAFVNQNEVSGPLNPDELFAKYSVAEMKAVQQRLRADADAKQEELRLMVGVGNGTVIYSFGEMRSTIGYAELPRTPKRAVSGEEDKYLQALQSLSAHLKLLLDAPEHLWRLMERRMYLHATWLFLLARVVHRALLREDDDDDQSWHAYGVDVPGQFPIVQRQWDTVSQFRSQITHKATLSLREHMGSPAEVCATLLTLHLLESRPLAETLSIFLSQRFKTLFTMLSHGPEQVGNGLARDAKTNTKGFARSRKIIVRDVKHRLETVFVVVVRTLDIARIIFSDNTAPHEASMMKRALLSIQAEDTPSSSLPVELQLTTHSLLTSLPSSTHFLLLPSSIRSYKPYVDSASLLSSMPQSQLQHKLEDWFHKAADNVRIAMEKWFSCLESIREVWDTRTFAYGYMDAATGLEVDEKTHLKSVVDEISQRRVVDVWKSSLSLAEIAFRDNLSCAIATLKRPSPDSSLDTRPVEYLFKAPPSVLFSQSGLNPSLATASFQKYKHSLQRQLAGRTPLLDTVLTSAERDTHSLQLDLEVIGGFSENSPMATRLAEDYRPDAEALCMRVADTLEQTADDILDDTEPSLRTLIFIGRLADDFASFSAFVTNIGCERATIDEFQQKMSLLYDRIIEKWREHTIRKIIKDSLPIQAPHRWSATANTSSPIRPSSGLMQSLLLLSTSTQQLGMSIHSARQQPLVEVTLRRYINRLHDHIGCNESTVLRENMQDLWDLAFLRRVACMWGDGEWLKVVQQLDTRMVQLRSKLIEQGASETQLEFDGALSEYLSRTQTLIHPFLPPSPSPSVKSKSTSLLRHGQPAVEQHVQPVLELVKPSPRFGLLLVGGGTVQ